MKRNYMLSAMTISLLIGGFIGCSNTTSTSTIDSIDRDSLLKEKDVSLIRLIAKPGEYNNIPVRVKGFLNIEFEGDALYLYKDDYQSGIEKNGIWIEIPEDAILRTRIKACSKKYVIIEGIFDANNRGHMNLFSGSLKVVTRVDSLGVRR